MGMDSVEIVLCWEDSLKINIPDERVTRVTTPKESIELLVKLVGCQQMIGPSIVQRAFHRVRHILVHEFDIARQRITLKSKFSHLFPKKNNRENWSRFCNLLGVDKLAITVGFPLYRPGGTTVEDVVIELTARKAHLFKKQNEAWAKNQIREIVRCSVMYVVGEKEFSDSANYVKDIGID